MNKIGKVITDDFELEYGHFGNGCRNLVIIPGISIKSVLLSIDAIEAGFSMFLPDYTVYVFDIRKKTPENFTVFDMAEDLAKAIEKIGLSSCYLYGASQGGMIALILASRYPELCSKVLVGSSSIKTDSASDKVFEGWISLIDSKDAYSLCESFMSTVYSEQTFQNAKTMIPSIAESVNDEDFRRFRIQCRACENVDLIKELATLRVPVFAIGGGRDAVFGGDSTKKLAEAIGAECYIYPDGSHCVYDEKEDYRARAKDFFGKE